MDDENKKKLMDTLDTTKQNMEALTDLITDIVEGQPETEAAGTSRGSEDTQGIFSRDKLHYTKYMTLSTVKLFETRGIEVLRIEDSVGLYFIVPNQPVRTAARSAHLRIVRIQEEFQDESHPPAFLQVGDWVYPLLGGSMVYKSSDNYYLFPDLVSTTTGSSVGVILPKSVGPEERKQFERLLLYFSEMDSFPEKAPPEFGKSTDAILKARTSLELVKSESGTVYSQKSRSSQLGGGAGGIGGCRSSRCYGWRIGQGIQAGGELVGKGLKYGAKGTAKAIEFGAGALKGVLEKEEGDPSIPCAVERGVGLAKDVTDRVVDISSQVWERVMEITGNFTGLTACYIRAQAEPVLRKWLEATGIPQEVLDEMEREARDLGEGLRGSFWEVYGGLDMASKVLADAVAKNTVQIVTHCYGPSAAKILCSAGEVVTNVAVGGNTARQCTDVKGMMKKTVKRAGWDICTAECTQREMERNRNALRMENLKPNFI